MATAYANSLRPASASTAVDVAAIHRSAENIVRTIKDALKSDSRFGAAPADRARMFNTFKDKVTVPILAAIMDPASRAHKAACNAVNLLTDSDSAEKKSRTLHNALLSSDSSIAPGSYASLYIIKAAESSIDLFSQDD